MTGQMGGISDWLKVDSSGFASERAYEWLGVE